MSYPLRGAPAYYQTNWFRILVAFMLLALLWAGYQLRVCQLQRAFKQVRNVIDTIPAMAWTAFPDGSNAFVNGRWTDFTGLSAQATGGWSWAAALHPDDRQRYSDTWRASVATGQPFESEARFRSASGEYRWFLARAVPLRDDRGKLVRWYGILTDIEDRKRAEQACGRSRAYLAEAQRLTHTGTWAWDAATLDTIYWSEKMFRIYGFHPQEGLPSTEAFWQRIHPEDRDRARNAAMKAAAEYREFEHDYRIVLPDGTVKYIHVIGRPVLDEMGSPVNTSVLQSMSQNRSALRRLYA